MTEIAQCLSTKQHDSIDSGLFVLDKRWAGSAQQDDVAAPLLNAAGGGTRTSDIDGATWVIES